MEEQERTELSLLRLFRQCAHIQHKMGHLHGQGRILILLLHHGAMTQRELADHTQRRSATLSEQLEAMEKAGLILRSKNSTDKRNVDVHLTEEGLLLARQAAFEREELSIKLFSCLDETQMQTLSGILQILKENWYALEQTETAEKETEL